MKKVKAYAALSANVPLAPFEIERRGVLPSDVEIEILYCGVCHSDLHCARNEWNNSLYPMVPGHEILGRVKGVGKGVKKFRVGDLAMVGCLVDSCRTCHSCQEGLEQYCETGFTLTYNSPDPHLLGQPTHGGYSTHIVVDEEYTLQVPQKFQKEHLPRIAPLVCAGITTYSPLRYAGVGKGTKVGVVGLGGLGHMAIKIAVAMGAEVTLFTSSPGKVQDGKRLGAHQVVLSRDPKEVERLAGTFDFILDTVSASHDLNGYVKHLKRDGAMCLLGVPERPHPVLDFGEIIFKRKTLRGSIIGGIRETQEMLEFCAEHQIVADIELIRMEQINEAYERMLKSQVKYRFVIDMSSLKQGS